MSHNDDSHYDALNAVMRRCGPWGWTRDIELNGDLLKEVWSFQWRDIHIDIIYTCCDGYHWVTGKVDETIVSHRLAESWKDTLKVVNTWAKKRSEGIWPRNNIGL